MTRTIISVSAQTGETIERPMTIDEIRSLPMPHHVWNEDTQGWVIDVAAMIAAKKVEYEAAVEHHLDGVAKASGYNTIYTAISYLGSSNPKWAAEATALRDWRDSVWQHVFAMYVDVEAGTIPIPDLQDVIDGLPAYEQSEV